MSAKVYVISDRSLIDFIEDNDVDGFRNQLEEDDTLYFDDPIEFDSEEEALAFCSGIGYGVDERAPVDRLPLRSFEEYDRPFIELIENY